MTRFVFLVLGTTLSGAALAHPGHPEGLFATAFWHAFTGVDVLLAAVCVGLVAARFWRKS